MGIRSVLGDGPTIRVLEQSAMILGDPEERKTIEITAHRLAKQAGYDQYIPGTFVIEAALFEAWRVVFPDWSDQQSQISLKNLTQQILEIEEDLHRAMVFTPTDELYRWFFGYAAINQLRQQILAQHPIILDV